MRCSYEESKVSGAVMVFHMEYIHLLVELYDKH